MAKNSNVKPAPKPRQDVRMVLVLCFVLAAAVGITYESARTLKFISIDDPMYVITNPHVKSGLSWEGVQWALTASRSANWHPLTWISHQADWQLFGSHPAGHHLVSLALHVINTILLLIVFWKMTGSIWKSAFVAAVFGLHPLRVESVAWIAERKDVLSGLFWMLTMLAYARYAERPRRLRYLAVAAALALGLMSKPMLVSLPLALLLLDLWPLGRSAKPGGWPRLVREKWPLFALAAASCVVTFIVQRHGGAVRTVEQYPLGERVCNALVSYLTYMWKMIWPADLAILYPHPENTLPIWLVALSGIVLAGITYAAILARRTRPYVTVGWFWYLITLAPVIGIVQVGQQAMADRYAYIPLIGLSVIVAWGLPELLRSVRRRNSLLAAGAAVVLVSLAIATWTQVGHWRNSIVLLRHAVKVTSGAPLVRYCLGDAFKDARRYNEALAEFDKALAVDPHLTPARLGAATALEITGRRGEAQKRLWEAVRFDSNSAIAHNSLGQMLLQERRFDDAIRQFQTAIRLEPGHAQADYNLGVALFQRGDLQAARAHLETAVRIDPDLSQAHCWLGIVLARLGEVDAGLDSFRTALKLDPDMPQLHYAFAMALYQAGDIASARQEVSVAQRLGIIPDPRFVKALSAGR